MCLVEKNGGRGRFEVVVVMHRAESSEWRYARKHGGVTVLEEETRCRDDRGSPQRVVT